MQFEIHLLLKKRTDSWRVVRFRHCVELFAKSGWHPSTQICDFTKFHWSGVWRAGRTLHFRWIECHVIIHRQQDVFFCLFAVGSHDANVLSVSCIPLWIRLFWIVVAIFANILHGLAAPFYLRYVFLLHLLQSSLSVLAPHVSSMI